jgi:ferredoxin
MMAQTTATASVLETERVADTADEADLAAVERRGWSLRLHDCVPKQKALASLSSLPAPEPLPSVSYASRGNVLVVGDDERALAAAMRLSASLPVTLLLTSHPSSQASLLSGAPLDAQGSAFPIWGGRVTGIEGYLGHFTVALANITVVREGPLGRALPAEADADFDLVVDLSDPPLYAIHQPPQGYWRVSDEESLERALTQAPESVGEFEKPRFFAYRESLCAHSRSGIVGCRACIDVCSTAAISSDGDRVSVDPHLCMGCGACATVCPSGAMSYQFPRVADRGAQMKAMLAAYRAAGGRDACLLFHNGTDGREALARSAAAGQGLPARAIPLESWHVAAVGIDLLLGAVALGASQVAVLAAGSEAPEYAQALRGQMALAQSILSALGYEGNHFSLVASVDEIGALAPAQSVPVPATFALSSDKRTAVEFAIDHLVRHAPSPRTEIALEAGAPWGDVVVDLKTCTLCLACAGACPESALMDGGDQPMLRFLERNCVQCGLCEKTCPESAITLNPRLLLTPAVREARVLNETQPFHCVTCGKPFGTKQMVDAMLGRLSGHSMFADGAALRRLQMCGDCRVVDMMSNKNEVSVLKL